jgi:hypothetical protein
MKYFFRFGEYMQLDRDRYVYSWIDGKWHPGKLKYNDKFFAYLENIPQFVKLSFLNCNKRRVYYFFKNISVEGIILQEPYLVRRNTKQLYYKGRPVDLDSLELDCYEGSCTPRKNGVYLDNGENMLAHEIEDFLNYLPKEDYETLVQDIYGHDSSAYL